MTEKRHEAEVRHSRFDALVRGHPTAMFAALAPDGFRVPMPASVDLGAERTIPPPAHRATLIDLVVLADGLAVVEAWQRAQRVGMSIGTVHTRAAPDRPLTLTFIDQRDRHGVIMASLTDQTGDQDADTGLNPSLLVPSRPRTGTIMKSFEGVITGIDERASRMLGWADHQIIGLRSTELIHPDDFARALSAWMEMLATHRPQRVRLRHRCSDSHWLWVELENTYHYDDGDHAAARITTQISDISDEMAAHDARDRQERLFRRLAESLPIGVIQLDPDGSLAYANSRLGQILGVNHANTLEEQLATVSGTDRPALNAALSQALEHGLDGDLEIDVEVPATGHRRCHVTLIALSDDHDGKPGALACVSDITESARARAELTVKATFDALTGCYNRSSIQALLAEALAEGQSIAVIFIDLDKFKPVNDTLGHAAGDELLVHTARCLVALLRDGDAVARLGGDEFVVVLRGADGPAAALAVAQRAHSALWRSVALQAGTVDLGASIGVAVSTAEDTIDSLLGRADAAMYESKRRGDGQPVLH